MRNAGFLGLVLSIAAFGLSACAADGESGEGDGASDAGGGGDGDGDGDGSETECLSDIVAMPDAPVCAAATETCIDACEEDDCFDTCVTADPDPEACTGCLDDAYVACGNQMGCQPEWDALSCCFDGCADPESAECETGCAIEVGTYENCLESFSDGCDEAAAICFQP